MATSTHPHPPSSTAAALAWLGVQRTRRNQGRLTPQQTAALDELAIRW
ncbi:hypothetical protein [Streptomyces sp. NPDC057748]